MTLSYSPSEAWEPLPEDAWNGETAAQLLRRAGWAAVPAEIERAKQAGLAATLDRLFPASPAFFPRPNSVADTEAGTATDRQRLREAEPAQRRVIQQEIRAKNQAAMLDMSIKWLQFSADPANAAFQKWVLFLSDVYVVAFAKVQRTWIIHQHFDIIARHALGPAPVLSKAVSRSPAMVFYLDLQSSRPEAPNENFARELFELFLLGEGNYTEQDIKQSAKAFTGYRLGREGQFRYSPQDHDSGPKTIFGHTGNFDGDDVIDLAYGTRAAGAFVPHELVKFYLSDTMLPKDYLYALGDAWRTGGAYDLRWLARRFFGAKIMYAPEFRGTFIKSPVQYYLGMIQDLQLDVLPAPRFIVNPLRQMGQMLFNPPNVRGWVGGPNWIDSTSLAARRALAESLFAPLNDRTLNQDELLDIVAAKTAGEDAFTVTNDRFQPLLALAPADAAERLTRAFLPTAPPADYRRKVAQFIADGGDETGRRQRLRLATIVLLESAEYQLC